MSESARRASPARPGSRPGRRPGSRPGRRRLDATAWRTARREARLRGQTAASIDHILSGRVSLEDLAVRFPEVEGNRLDLLVEGKRVWPKVFRDIERATGDVHINMYGMEGDEFGWAMARLLARKVREDHIRVVIVADLRGARMNRLARRETHARAQALFDFYRQSGIQVVFYSRSQEVLRHPGLRALKGLYRYDHRKMIIIDGKVGYIGGLTLQTPSARDKHDFMMRMAGPVVHQLEASFLLGYRYDGGTLEALGVKDRRGLIERFFPAPPRGPPAPLGRSSRRARRHERPHIPKTSAGPFPTARPAHRRSPSANPEVGRRGTARIVSNVPGEAQHLTETILAQIRGAHEFLYVVQPYITDRRILGELIRARRRGVDVRVVLPGVPENPLNEHMVAHAVDRLQAARVDVMRYRGPRDLGLLHGKLFLTESMLSVGSMNGDAAAVRRNLESDVVTTDPRAIRRVKAQLLRHTFAESEPAARRPRWGRAVDAARSGLARAFDWLQY